MSTGRSSGVPFAESSSFRSHAMLEPTALITDTPSPSRMTSSGVFPCTMFQYVEGTAIMLFMPMYLLSTS